MIISKAKGPAALAGAPDHGSINPTEDTNMNSTEDSTAPAVAPVPTIHDVHLRVLELITLLEVVDHFTGDMHFTGNGEEHVKSATRVMNLVSVAGRVARGIDGCIDDLTRGRMA